MDIRTKSICFATLFMLLSAVATIAIGYTNFVQAELKEDNKLIRSDLDKIDVKSEINNEKITNLQITNSRIEGKLDLLLQRPSVEILK